MTKAMMTSAMTIQVQTGTPNTFLFRSASKLPFRELGLDGLLGEEGLEGIMPAIAVGLLGLLGTTPAGELGLGLGKL